MNRLVFLLEEYSMKVLLDGLIPRLFPAWCSSACGTKEGVTWRRVFPISCEVGENRASAL